MNRIAALLIGSSMIAAPALAQAPATPPTAAPATQPAAAATAAAPTPTAEVAAGATVADTAGGAVGTIESVTNGIAVLSTGSNKVSIPVGSFAKGANGLVIAMTKAEIDQKASAATAAATGPAEITVGAVVADQTGAKIGTVKAVTGDMVTVQSATASAQLPKASFAKGPNGLVIAMTPAQFDAAAKAAGGAKPATAG